MAKKEVSMSAQQVIRMYEQERARLEEMNSRLQNMANYYQELKAAEDSLKDIKEADKGTSIMVPLGAGVNMEARIESKDSVKVMKNNICLEKKLEEALKEIEEKKGKAEKAIREMEQNIEKVFLNVDQFSRVIRMQKKAREKAAKNV